MCRVAVDVPEDFRRAGEVLAGLGFSDVWAGVRQSERNSHADNWVRMQAGGTFFIDLHHRIELTQATPARVWHVLLDGAETVTIGGRPVACPGAAVRCALLALHAAQHGFGQEKPLEDLRRGRALEPAEVWKRAAGLAHRLAATAPYDLGLALLTETPDTIRHSEAWQAAGTELRLYASNVTSSGFVLHTMLARPVHQRVAYAASRLFASPARLRLKQGRQAPPASLYRLCRGTRFVVVSPQAGIETQGDIDVNSAVLVDRHAAAVLLSEAVRTGPLTVVPRTATRSRIMTTLLTIHVLLTLSLAVLLLAVIAGQGAARRLRRTARRTEQPERRVLDEPVAYDRRRPQIALPQRT